jgi:hypothetical protein
MTRTGRYAHRTDALVGHKNAPGRAATARGLAIGAVSGKALRSLKAGQARCFPPLHLFRRACSGWAQHPFPEALHWPVLIRRIFMTDPGPASNLGNAVGEASGSAAGKLSSLIAMMAAVCAAPARVQPNSRHVSRKPTVRLPGGVRNDHSPSPY